MLRYNKLTRDLVMNRQEPSLFMTRKKKLIGDLVLDRYSCSQLKMTPYSTTERTILSRTKNFTLSLRTLVGYRYPTNYGTLMIHTIFAQMAFINKHQQIGKKFSIMYVKAIMPLLKPKPLQMTKPPLKPKPLQMTKPPLIQKRI